MTDISDDNGYDEDEPRRRRRLGRVGEGAARRLKSLSFNRIFPNMLTLLAACAGLTAIRYGIGGQWDRAIIALTAAGMLDGVEIVDIDHGIQFKGVETKPRAVQVTGKIGFSSHPMLEHFKFLKANTKVVPKMTHAKSTRLIKRNLAQLPL